MTIFITHIGSTGALDVHSHYIKEPLAPYILYRTSKKHWICLHKSVKDICPLLSGWFHLEDANGIQTMFSLLMRTAGLASTAFGMAATR